MIQVFKVLYDSVIKNFWKWVVLGFLWFLVRLTVILLVAVIGLIAGIAAVIGNSLYFIIKETKIALGIGNGS